MLEALEERNLSDGCRRNAVVFLLSDRLAGYVTGTELLVDGGLHLRPMFHGGDEALAALSFGEAARP